MSDEATDKKIAELQAQIDELRAGQRKPEAKMNNLGDWGGGGRSNRLMDAMMSGDVMPKNVTDAMVEAWDPGIVDDLRRRASPYVQAMWAKEREKQKK